MPRPLTGNRMPEGGVSSHQILRAVADVAGVLTQAISLALAQVDTDHPAPGVILLSYLSSRADCGNLTKLGRSDHFATPSRERDFARGRSLIAVAILFWLLGAGSGNESYPVDELM